MALHPAARMGLFTTMGPVRSCSDIPRTDYPSVDDLILVPEMVLGVVAVPARNERTRNKDEKRRDSTLQGVCAAAETRCREHTPKLYPQSMPCTSKVSYPPRWSTQAPRTGTTGCEQRTTNHGQSKGKIQMDNHTHEI